MNTPSIIDKYTEQKVHLGILIKHPPSSKFIFLKEEHINIIVCCFISGQDLIIWMMKNIDVDDQGNTCSQASTSHLTYNIQHLYTLLPIFLQLLI